MLPVEAEGRKHCWHLFVVLASDREAFRARLRERGVETLVHYPEPIHRQAAYAHLPRVDVPVSERLCEQVVSLPLYPELTDAEAERVVEAVACVRFRRQELGQTPAGSVPASPEWEHIPEGWSYPARGWDADVVADAYARKWPDYVAAIRAPNPLGVHHETAEVLTGDAGAHNMLVTFAYVLALAADGRDRLSVLDWGGGLGHYQVLARSVLPRLTLDWHVQETPRGRRARPSS